MHGCRYFAAPTLALGFVLFAASLPTSAQAQDRFLGTWMLDTDKSMYQRAEVAPERRILILEAADGGLRYTSRTWRPGNRTNFREVSYVAKYDGTEVTLPASGAKVMLMHPDAMTVKLHATALNGGMEDQTWTLSDDGQMLTIAVEGRDTTGAAFHNMLVYQRDDAD